MVWALFGVLWVMPQSVTDLFSAWQGPFCRHRNIYFWRGCPTFYGVFGEKGTLDALRERNGLFSRLNLSFSTLCWIGFLFLILFQCSNFLDMLDHCNLQASCTAIHVHFQCN